jgi:protein PhnA
MNTQLFDRAESACELCRSSDELAAFEPQPSRSQDLGDRALLCALCKAQCAPDAELDTNHLHCLHESAWSQVAAVQVLAYRLLSRLNEGWGQELRDQLYIEDEVLEWAKTGLDEGNEEIELVRDSNGTALNSGDSVTLIKDLDVKGTSFTAKRGTTVKNIRLSDDPGHIEGRVNGVTIMLKIEFLKKL